MPPENQQVPPAQPAPQPGENIVPPTAIPAQPIQPQVVSPQPVQPNLPPAPTVITPESAPMSPAPVSVAPTSQLGVITPAAQPDPMQPAAPAPFVGGPTVGAPAYAPGTTMGNKAPTISKRSLMVIGGVVGLVVIGLLVYLLAFNKSISATDVSNAQNASEAIFKDINDSSTALEESALANSSDEVKSKLSLAKTKLADAQKNYQTLSKSHVLYDKNVKAKFKVLDSKWNPYITFENNGVSDDQQLLPVLLDFTNDTDEANKNIPTTAAEVSDYLTQLKAAADKAVSQLQSVKVTLSENQQLLDDMKTYLSSISSVIGTAQSDLNSGKDLLDVEDDLFNLDDGTTKFENQADSISSQLDDHEKKLSPSSELSAFETSLDQLASKVGTSK